MRAKQSGLTLLEVMVAILIFGLTGTALLKAAGDHLNGLSRLEANLFATYVANNRLNLLQVSQQWPPKQNQRGQVDMAGTQWFWQQTVSKTPVNGLLSVTVQVASDQTMTNRITAVTAYMSQPSQAKQQGQNND